VNTNSGDSIDPSQLGDQKNFTRVCGLSFISKACADNHSSREKVHFKKCAKPVDFKAIELQLKNVSKGTV
jgi:hypothetical protein